MAAHRSGFVALIGKPNVGKSTLINALVGHKVSIVSNKAQTTRKRVLGVLTHPDYQIAFFDTPGVHEPHTQLGKLLNEAASSVLTEVDVLLVVVDASRKYNREDEAIATMVRQATKGEDSPKVLLCLNKMDLLKPHDVVEQVESACKMFGTEIYMLTDLLRGHNLPKLLEMLIEHLPEGPPLYPDEEYTDQTTRFMVAELIREKVLIRTRQEVPHAVATLVDHWQEAPNNVSILASIFVEKEGQKAILIGKGGAMLKQVGAEARAEIEALLERKVFLELQVKVRPDWRQNPRMLHELEYGPS